MTALLSASCRVAFAALIHDLGKFTQRAKLPIALDALDAHKSFIVLLIKRVLPFPHTSYSLDQIESYLPDLIKEQTYPFASYQSNTDASITDSLINVAAAHHKPDTFLQ
ncbi:MAG: hypothetical protein SOX56_06930 [[Pasteurella] mairii]|uniref:HD domain-containing protein n=1 Tax=[Pasteurella] mairii TaxID=757 RepID=A0A379B614_9PAST|nr:hypothetical protein [[Pasteurella] mairii]SUB34063.1 Uncharacterised protein [[Pasteurella] mairii]